MNVKKILLSVGDFLNKAEEKRMKEFIDSYRANPLKVEQGLFDSLDDIFNKVREKQASTSKGKVKCICFSFMYTNFMIENHALRIDVYDENLWCGDLDVVGEWNIESFFKGCKDDVKNALSILSSDYINIKPHEEKSLYNGYIYDYYALAFSFLKVLVQKVKDMESFRKMELEDEVIITLGEYKDKMETICCISSS